MAAPGFPGQLQSGGGQKDRTIRLRGHEPVALQPPDGAVDGDVGDAEPAGEIRHPRLTGGGDQLRNQFRIVLGGLLGMLLAVRCKPGRERRGAVLAGKAHRED